MAVTRSHENTTPWVFGLAGGIGAGKSHVARAFERRGWLIFDFDALTREALATQAVARTLADWWGPGVLSADGEVDRKAVGRIVFDDEAQRHRLEALIHPLVWRTREQALEVARAAGAPGVIFDAPLLFEAGLDAECDAVIFVAADRPTRAARVKASRGWSIDQLKAREGAQLPLEEKRSRSRFVIDNVAGARDLDQQIDRLLAERSAADAG